MGKIITSEMLKAKAFDDIRKIVVEPSDELAGRNWAQIDAIKSVFDNYEVLLQIVESFDDKF